MKLAKLPVLIFCFIAVVLSSCSSIVNPSIERIENVKIAELSTKMVRGTADMVLKNDNDFALDLAETDLVAMVDDIELATIKQTYDTKMPANAEFKMPIELNLSFQKFYDEDPIGAMGKGMQIYSKREINIRFVGTIKMGKGAAKITVPVDQTELVKF